MAENTQTPEPAPNTVPLEALIEAHGNEVYGYLRVVCRNHQMAEDLSQEVFLLAWRRGLTPGPGLSHWFRSVARNLALNELTRKKPVLWDAEALRKAEPAAPDTAAHVNPFEDDLATLRSALRNLPEEDRRLLNARYAGEEPLAAISEKTGQSVGYLKQRLLRLRRKLARAFGLRLQEKASERDRARTLALPK